VKSLDLVATAKRLIGVSGKKRPRQSDLKRAVSTAYYALFHALCRNCADSFVGGAGADRSTPAWRQAYRAVDHGAAKNQFKNAHVMSRFPQAIEDFGNLFVDLQTERHKADYDPNHRCNRSDVNSSIAAAETVIKGLAATTIKDRRALAAWVLLKDRP
jgi:uncharacterized protein (UPF0332 family)